jgi:hypothetical protein
MALPADLSSAGPAQQGRGQKGQYVYLIVFSHPKPDTVQRFGLKAPCDFSRTTFKDLARECHTAHGIELVETACFQERHANGEIHLNLLVRSRSQFKWKKAAEEFRSYDVHVNYAPHIKTWSEGVAYLKVGSDHKPADIC